GETPARRLCHHSGANRDAANLFVARLPYFQRPRKAVIAPEVDGPGPACGFAGGATVLGEVETEEGGPDGRDPRAHQRIPRELQLAAPDVGGFVKPALVAQVALEILPGIGVHVRVQPARGLDRSTAGLDGQVKERALALVGVDSLHQKLTDVRPP